MAESEDLFCIVKSKTSIEIENIEKALVSPISLVNIQKALDCLSHVDSALQIGTKNETVLQAQVFTQKAFVLLSQHYCVYLPNTNLQLAYNFYT
jgi:hypothetical protein